MKKNVKFLGVAAAALLAVAPVVSTGVVNAETINVTPGTGVQTTEGGNVTASLVVNNANQLTAGTSVSSVATSLTAQLNDKTALSVALGEGGKVQLYKVDDKGQVEANAVSGNLEAGATYVAKATNVYVTGLKGDSKDYTYGANKTALTVNGLGNAVLPETITSAPFTVTNTSIVGTPYFTVNGTYSTAASVPVAAQANGQYTVQSLLNAISTNGIAAQAGNTANKLTGTSSVAELTKALEDLGVKVTNGSFTAPANSVTLPYNAYFLNGKSASINVTFTFNNHAQSDAPVISVKDANKVTVANTDKTVYNWNTVLPVNSTFSVNDVATAFQATVQDGSANLVTPTASGSVDTSKPGTYKVVVSATNPAGKTSRVTVNVTVGDKDATYKTVKYVAGYGVNVWSINGNKVTFTGNRTMDGVQVATYGTTTVNGVSYTRVGSKDSNTWIQTQYLDGSYKPADNGEEKVSGVLTVRYNGKGSVGLVNANGKYTGKYVVKNARYKVFAKKTINGRECYRIGNQNQWIPAEFSELSK